MNVTETRTYRALRQRGVGTAEALRRARTSTKPLWPSDAGDTFGAPFGDGLRWIERPEAAGLRFVGFADELAGRAIDHKGWFTSPDGDTGETLRGAVYQLPARGRRPIYVAGYQEQGFGLEGAVALALGELFYGEPGGEELRESDATRDAAFRADRIAEIQAEAERDYAEAWGAGARWANLGEEIADARSDALAILKERRQVALPPAMCTAVHASVAEMLRRIRDARAKRAELASGYWQADAFNEGAGAQVLS